VLSGGERTRLAVARMLLRPSNTLLLDEPTNHLDLDSKEVLLDALADYGGTLIFVSHDRYFVERLASRIVEVGDGRATLYPGTYTEFLWSKEHGAPALGTSAASAASAAPGAPSAPSAPTPLSYDEQKRDAAERRKRERARKNLRDRIAELEARIAEREAAIKALEASMSAPGFYDAHAQVKPVLDQHQALMWEVGELLNQWEMLQSEADEAAD
jgi:ATP-binding cassette subfamily F protein 3